MNWELCYVILLEDADLFGQEWTKLFIQEACVKCGMDRTYLENLAVSDAEVFLISEFTKS